MKEIVRKTSSLLKNSSGWKTDQQYLAFSVDDYGTVRTANRDARSYLRDRIPGFGGQMDDYDSVETRQDLEQLFEVLSSHCDIEGNPAIFTAYCLAANPDFEKIRRERVYSYEKLSKTYQRLESVDPIAYSGMEKVWEQGMTANVVRPQSHGREHFCVPLIEQKLKRREPDLEANLEVESMAGLIQIEEFPGVSFTHALALDSKAHLLEQRRILSGGLRLFEEFFGFRSITFTPPALKLNRAHYSFLMSNGVRALDVPFIDRKTRWAFRLLPKMNHLDPPASRRIGRIVRTVSFEPCSGIKSDPVGSVVKAIHQAFRLKKPVIISSHRVNYCGHIDPSNRRRGLGYLEALLSVIRREFPAVQFVSVDDLIRRMEAAQ